MQRIGKKNNKSSPIDDFVPVRAFWFSSFNYYFLASAIAVAVFFTVWGALHTLEDEVPWITAGVAASLLLLSAVVLREQILRKNYQKAVFDQKRLDYHTKNVYKVNRHQNGDRLTLERNAEVLKEIEHKSQAANSFAKLSAAHFEVFEICEAYLRKSGRELGGITKSSPRFIPLSKGQKRVRELHRYHLLAWASLASQNYVQDSKTQTSTDEKVEKANRALEVIEIALDKYPEEQKLLDSLAAVKDFIISLKVSAWIELAERAAHQENYEKALNHYRDALIFLAEDNDKTPERELMARQIKLEIENIKEISTKDFRK